MDWGAIGAIGEILGAIAVVATLLYLAKQTRVNTRAVISTSRSASTIAISEIDRSIAQDPELAKLVYKSMQAENSDWDELEWFQFTNFARSLVYVYEDQYMQSLAGTADPQMAASHIAGVIAFLEFPAWKQFWETETSSDVWGREFTNAVNTGQTTARISGSVIAGRA